MRKRTIFALSLAFLLVLFFSWDSILSATFQWYLKGYCRSCLHGTLSYDSVKRENGIWTLVNPSVDSFDSLDEGGYHFHSEEINVETAISLGDPSIKFIVSLREPEMELGKGAMVAKKIMDQSHDSSFFFPVYTHFNTTKGKLLIHGFGDAMENPIPLYFGMNVMCTDARKGCLNFSFDSEIDDHPFHAVLSEPSPQTYRWKITMDDFNIQPLALIARGVWPEYIPFETSSGNLTGDVSITFPKDGKPYAEGKIHGKDLQLNLPQITSTFSIPVANLTMDQKNIENGPVPILTIGYLDIPENAAITIYKEGELFRSLQELRGSIAFKTGDGAHLKLEGRSKEGDVSRPLTITGNTGFSKQGLRGGTFHVLLEGEGVYDRTTMQFTMRQIGENWTFAEVEVMGLGKPELDFLKHFASLHEPIWNEIHVEQGNLDAGILVYFNKWNIGEVKVEHAAVRDFSFVAKPWNVAGNIKEAIGSLSCDVSSFDPLSTLTADVHSTDGEIAFTDSTKSVRQMNTDLVVRRGKIQKSQFKGNFFGLNGNIVLDETGAGPFISLECEGEIEKLRPFMSEKMLSGIDKKFNEDKIKIIATGDRNREGLNFSGTLFVDDHSPLKDEIAFGFSINNENLGPKEGWFEAKKLPLDKYISPFLFLNDQMQLAGTGEFKGIFDQRGMKVVYNANDMVLENSDFCIEVKNLAEGKEPEERFVAEHYFDFDKGNSHGTIPIKLGTYFEKNSGLLFTDIHTIVNLEEIKAHMADLEGYCNGALFGGTIDVDWSMPGEGVFVVDMDVQKIQGKFSELQHFISHFNKNYFFLKIPIDGEVSLHQKCGKIHIDFELGDFHVQSHLEGKLTDAKLLSSSKQLNMQELSLNFVYDHAANTLEFSDIQGTILVGSSKHVDEYTFSSNNIRFKDYTNNVADFDLTIGDKQREIIRLVGNTTIGYDKNGVQNTRLNLDTSLSHFGDIRPTIFEVTMKGMERIENIRTDFTFNLNNLLTDLKKFSRTGLFFLSKNMLRELNKIKSARGDFVGDLTYNGDRSLLSYQISARDVGVGKYSFNKIVLIGTKNENQWTVDQFQLDEISLAADLRKEKETWKINFLGATLGKFMALGMDGHYNSSTAELMAKINLLEFNLGEKESLEFLKPISEDIPFLGYIKAAGLLKANFGNESEEGVFIDFSANGSLKDASLKGLHLQDMDNVSFHYLSDVGFTVGDIRTAFLSPKNPKIQNSVFLEKASCDFVNKEVRIDGLSFSVPASNLEWLAENLQQSFPEEVTPDVAEIIRNLKTEGTVQGGLKITFSKPHSGLLLTLTNGTYKLFDQDHTISKFMLEYDPLGVKIATEYLYQNNWYWLQARSANPNFEEGQLEVSELAINNYPTNKDPLRINWRLDPINGCCIDKVQGTLSGLNFNLVRDKTIPLTPDQLSLTGAVTVNMRNAVKLLNPEIAAKAASWEVGDGYSLYGQWCLKKGLSIPLTERLCFQGVLSGNNFEFFGYRFNSMSADLNYAKGHIALTSLNVNDPCGSFHAGEIVLWDDGSSQWFSSVPLLTITQFRPCLLDSGVNVKPAVGKALLIRQMEIQDLRGVVGNKNSFTGYGKLTFTNSNKKNPPHPIFAIPSEILSRIGLDLGVLTPARGAVYYNIEDGKVNFKRFKDVYSKGKISKFYLPNNGYQSYIDFDGNVHMQVRMKQYNLLFKLAELFTVNIQGTLKKPIYSLQKQSKQDYE